MNAHIIMQIWCAWKRIQCILLFLPSFTKNFFFAFFQLYSFIAHITHGYLLLIKQSKE